MKQRSMPMTDRQLKREIRRADRMEERLWENLRTSSWLGIADAHIARPESSLVCRMRFYASKMLSVVGLAL